MAGRVAETYATFLSVHGDSNYVDSLGTMAASLALTKSSRGLIALIDGQPTERLRCLEKQLASMMRFRLLQVPRIANPLDPNKTYIPRKVRT